MSLHKRFLTALIAAVLALTVAPALGETPADYDMSAPQNLSAGHLYAQSALLVDMATGEVLFSKNSKIRMYPASTTKIMTLLLGLESGIALDAKVTVPNEAADIAEGSSVIPVQPGDVLSFGDLLYGFMLSSGNDGANAIAVLTDGSIDAFVAHMNARAAELGLDGTHYANAHGYHDADHYTTAQDLAKLSRYAMTNADFRAIVATPTWTVSLERNGQPQTVDIVSRNSLLQSGDKYYYPDCTGIKTGHHKQAGWCFVGSAQRDGMEVICVVLNCPQEFDKWYDAARLFEYGFTRYDAVTASALLERAKERFARVQVSGADPTDPEGGSLLLNLSVQAGGDAAVRVVAGSQTALDAAASALAEGLSVGWRREPVAPVEAGEALGDLTCEVNGTPVAAVLTASRAVAAAQPTPAPRVVEAPPAAAQSDDDAIPASASADLPDGAASEAPRGNAVLLLIALLAGLLAVSLIALAYARALRRKRRRRRRRRRR